jgi:hypothetical protein
MGVALGVATGAVMFGVVARVASVRTARATTPLRVAYWYWHHPFRFSSADAGLLRTGRVDRLYVHAGTLTVQSGRLVLASIQRWDEPSPLPVYAVYRVSPAALSPLLEPSSLDQVARLVRNSRLPASISGVQWDADVPTRQLGRYAAFLRQVRSRLPTTWRLSATGLPAWIGAPGYREVCDALDEIAPQFYGNVLPRDLRSAPALWETRSLLDRARRSAAGRARVWIGLPSYGRCLLFGPDGRFAGVRHDLDPQPLLEELDWEVTRARTRQASLALAQPLGPSLARPRSLTSPPGGSQPLESLPILPHPHTPTLFRDSAAPPPPALILAEDELALRSTAPAMAGPLDVPDGNTLLFQWPRAAALRQALAAIERNRPAAIEGVCLFRWPTPGEPLAVDPSRILLAPPSRAAGVDLGVELHSHAGTVDVAVVNHGMDSPPLEDGIGLTIEPGGGTLAGASLARVNAPRDGLRAPGGGVRLSLPLLRPGERWKAATVVRPSGRVTVTVAWRDGSGDGRTHSASIPSRGTITTPRPSVAVGKSRG